MLPSPDEDRPTLLRNFECGKFESLDEGEHLLSVTPGFSSRLEAPSQRKRQLEGKNNQISKLSRA